MLFCQLINVKMPTFFGILTLMSRKNSMFYSVELDKSFITSGPGNFNLTSSFTSRLRPTFWGLSNDHRLLMHFAFSSQVG